MPVRKARPQEPSTIPPQCYPAPTRRYRPRTFGYPCCGRGRSAGCRRRSGKHPRGTVVELAAHQNAEEHRAYDSSELQLILCVLGCLDVDTGPHVDLSDDLLTDEVSDLNLVAVGLGVLVDVHVDGETAQGLVWVRSWCLSSAAISAAENRYAGVSAEYSEAGWGNDSGCTYWA
jgi:hypothetical protein